MIPWPMTYETLATRMLRNQQALGALDIDWATREAQDRLMFVDDAPFRADALIEARRVTRPLSLADHVMRAICQDPSCTAGALLTTNINDFRDLERTCPVSVVDCTRKP